MLFSSLFTSLVSILPHRDVKRLTLGFFPLTFRITAATYVHDASSRSHAIFTIQYTQVSSVFYSYLFLKTSNKQCVESCVFAEQISFDSQALTFNLISWCLVSVLHLKYNFFKFCYSFMCVLNFGDFLTLTIVVVITISKVCM